MSHLTQRLCALLASPVLAASCAAVTTPESPVEPAIASGIDYFVDPYFTGPSGDGTSPFSPLKDLSALRPLLGSPTDLSGTRIWLRSGTSLHLASGDLVIRASGSEGAPIQIGTYRSASPSPGALVLIDPVLDARDGGGFALLGPGFDVEPGGSGIRLIGANHVDLVGLEVSGFMDGVHISGCEHVRISGCMLHSNRVRGVLVGPMPGLPDGAASRHITVEGSYLYDNGMDTRGSNLGFGPRCGTCVVTGCEFASNRPGRGVDGIVFDASSSGHLVESNLFRDMSSLPDGVEDGDGIDLKAVLQRDPEDDPITWIRDNRIIGNDGAGIVIHDGCRDLQIEHNVVNGNRYGVFILPGQVRQISDLVEAPRNPYAPDSGNALFSVQEDLRIEHNEISSNLRDGVLIDMKSGGAICHADADGCPGLIGGTAYRNVSVTFNEIDDNGSHGVTVLRYFTDTEASQLRGSDETVDPVTLDFSWFHRRLEDIQIQGNLLRRNGGAVDTGYADLQLLIVNLIESTACGESDVSEVQLGGNLMEAPSDSASPSEVVGLRTWSYSADPEVLAYVSTTPSQERLTMPELEAIGFDSGSRVAGHIAEYGSGCTGSLGTILQLAESACEPLVGHPLSIALSGSGLAEVPMLILGWSRTDLGGIPLPLPLQPLGSAPDCELLVATDVVLRARAPSAGDPLGGVSPTDVLFDVRIDAPSAIGLTLYCQAITAGSSVPGGLAVSNGLEITFGGIH